VILIVSVRGEDTTSEEWVRLQAFFYAAMIGVIVIKSLAIAGLFGVWQ